LTSPPVITQFMPGNGRVGTEVNISGQNFGQESMAVSVTFGSQPTPANPSFCGNEAIRINVPDGATTGKITVKTSGGETKSTETFFLPPGIATVYPNSGPPGYITGINGKNFDPSNYAAHVVKFNGIQAKVVHVGPTSVQVEVPAGATTGPITVETPGGTATSPQVFTVVR
jgi:hypothetical protein